MERHITPPAKWLGLSCLGAIAIGLVSLSVMLLLVPPYATVEASSPDATKASLQSDHGSSIRPPASDLKRSGLVGRVAAYYSDNRTLVTMIMLLLLMQSAVIIGLAVSIAKGRQTEDALKDSQTRYRRIFENIQDAYYESAFDGKILEVSPSIEKVLGYPRQEMIGRSFYEFYTYPSDRQTLLSVLQEKVHVPDYELKLKTKSGGNVHCAINAMLLKGDDGQPARIVGSMRDIETRKQDEAEKRELRERLLRVEKMEAIATVAGGVAHDLNNILSGLTTYPELLLLECQPHTKMHQSLKIIHKSGLKAAAIVKDLLTLTRRGVVIKEPVQLNDVVRDYLTSPEFEKLKAFHPGVQFDVRLADDLSGVTGSAIHMAKAVMNLVSNAAEAIPGEGLVTIRTENKRLDTPLHGYEDVCKGSYVVLTVADNGHGIAPEDQGKIFEPFYTKKKMGRSGTGLGMAVVWGTIKDHDGYIDLKSRTGSGTILEAYLPATMAEQHVPRPAATAKSCITGKERILVVDDVVDQRDIATLMLSRLGYQVDAVASGEAAIEILRSQPADLLILDMIMDPGMDGLDTYKAALALRPDQRAIIASGYAETDRVREALRLGAGAFIGKPYSIETLGQAVRTELDK